MNIAFRGQVRTATETNSHFEYVRYAKQYVCVAYETDVSPLKEDNDLDADCGMSLRRTQSTCQTQRCQSSRGNLRWWGVTGPAHVYGASLSEGTEGFGWDGSAYAMMCNCRRCNNDTFHIPRLLSVHAYLSIIQSTSMF